MESIRALGVLMSLEGMHSSIKTVPENLEDDCDGEIAQNGLLLVLENPIDKEAIEKAIPVSYTHLDVYKRQINICICRYTSYKV